VKLTKEFRADLVGMRAQIDSNTVCIVGSAPEYAFGFFDALPQISAMAIEFGINCHSDCCLGSYLNPFIEEAGFKLPCDFDFKLPGVTSISCDPHKFCYGPKGCSVILFRNRDLRRHSFCAISTWPGGMYVTPTIDKAKLILGTAEKLRHDIAKIPEIKIYSWQHNPVVSFTSDKVNFVAVNDILMKKHKWTLNTIQMPLSAHLVVTDANAANWATLAPALRETIDYLMKHPEENNRGDAALYGLSEKIPNKGVVGNFLVYYLEAVLDSL
jgi:sphinganine-1-phosphate aldolase